MQSTDDTPVIDALPYIDPSYADNPTLKTQIAKLVSEEMQRSRRKLKSYTAELEASSQPVTFETTTFFKDDLQRLTEEKQLPERIDHTRHYTTAVTIPDDQAALTEDEWNELVNKLYVQIEYTNKRQYHLELLNRYGKEVWPAAIQRTLQLVNHVKTASDQAQQNSDYINQLRKYNQDQVHESLDGLKRHYMTTVDDNYDVALAVAELRVKRQRR